MRAYAVGRRELSDRTFVRRLDGFEKSDGFRKRRIRKNMQELRKD